MCHIQVASGPKINFRITHATNTLYSFAVDTFTAGLTLVELIQPKFYETLKKYLDLKQLKTGNNRIDEIAPFIFFMVYFKELNFNQEEINEMLR